MIKDLEEDHARHQGFQKVCSLIRSFAAVACSLSVFVPKRLSSHPFSPAIPISFADEEYGPEGIRTLGHLVKSQMLYLAELQAQKQHFFGEHHPLNIVFIRCGGGIPRLH